MYETIVDSDDDGGDSIFKMTDAGDGKVQNEKKEEKKKNLLVFEGSSAPVLEPLKPSRSRPERAQDSGGRRRRLPPTRVVRTLTCAPPHNQWKAERTEC